MPQILPYLLLLLLLMNASSCSSSDPRITKMASEQARQNEALAKQHEQIVVATQTLIEADKQARDDFASLTEKLQAEQAVVNQGRDALEADRRQIAAQRNRDPIVASAILNLGLLIACLLPFAVCIYALRMISSGAEDPLVLNGLLVEELLAEQPLLPMANMPLIEGPAAAESAPV